MYMVHLAKHTRPRCHRRWTVTGWCAERPPSLLPPWRSLHRRPRLTATATAVVSLMFVAVVIAWGFHISGVTYNAITSLATLINRAGRQRMISQRLCLYSPLNLGAPADAQAVSSPLLVQFEETQSILAAARPDIVTHYDEFMAALGGSSFEHVLMCGARFLSLMEVYVMELEQESQKEVARLRTVRGQMTVVITGVGCMVGLLVWLFIRDQGRLLEAEQTMIQYLFHEIRNPLNHVVNGIESVLFDTPSLDPEAATHLQACRKGGELITCLLDDVLNIAKLESGEPLNLQPTRVSETCATAVGVSALSAASRKVRCHFIQGPGCDGHYQADGTRLSQVLLNLLSNAIKYVGDGGLVTLRLDLVHRTPQGQHQLTFSVEDDGPGVPVEGQASLFVKFRTFNQNSGAGLGLHLTSVIVGRMGGRVKVTSPIPGSERGARFSFTVLLNEVQAVQTKALTTPVASMPTRPTQKHTGEALNVTPGLRGCAASPVMPPSSGQRLARPVGGGEQKSCGVESANRLHSLRVLVVDDESINLRILVRKLEREPVEELEWAVDTASSLPECLEKATTGPPYDILFLDEHFNGDKVTGSAYIKTLRHRGVKAAVFMCSANCSTSDEVYYRKLGAVGVLPKPVPNGATLLAVVSHGLRCHYGVA